MQLISKFNKGVYFYSLLFYALLFLLWVLPLKYKKRITITNAFQKSLDESNHKANKI